MKDTAINYDLVHQQQQQHQQQQHSWNHQRQQQHQTHTTSVYSNHSANQTNSQRNAIGGHHHQHHHHHHTQQQQQQQQQGQQHPATPLGQYQQIQPATHHNTAAAAAAYYQQAHLYPTYQTHSQDQSQQQQQAGSEHHHHGASAVNATGAPTSVVNAVVANSQQQHTGIHQNTGSQASALNHTGWSQSLAPQAHHAVVTDHSTLAYMTHAYQSHNSSVSDHRNTNASISNQLLGTGPQASSYTVDSLYNTPAAAAAVAAYGYNNYNAAFFQTSNNGPHSQTGHPSPAGFWGHTQSQQQRTSHTQAVSNQAPHQQRQQQMTSDQTSNYIHDPRMYYGRSPYNQGLQNFTQPHSQTQHQSDVVHHRMKSLNQPSLVQHDQQIQQMTQTQQHLLHATNLVTQQTPTNQNAQLDQQQSNLGEDSSSQSTSSQNPQHTRKVQSIGLSPQHPSSIRQTSDDMDTNIQETRNDSNYDQVDQIHQTIQQSNLSNAKSSQQMVSNSTNYGSTVSRSNAPNDIQEAAPRSLSPVNKSISVIKSDSSGQYQARKPSSNSPPQAQLKSNYKVSHSEISKSQNVEVTKKVTDKDQSSNVNSDSKTSTNVRQDSSEQHSDPLENSMASLAITARKTTWASIASQPAKVSQPKSLKSKIAGSNSVFSSAKHLTSVSSIDSSGLDSKNSINPAIKSSVSAAATSIPRSSVPPPISKATPPPNLNLKLDILGETESGKISWPAVNASINLTLDEPIPKKEESPKEQPTYDDRFRKDDNFKARDYRDQTFRDHNHNHGSNRMNNNHQRRDDYWQRRDQREYNRIRRDSDRKELDFEKRQVDLHDEGKEHPVPRRDMKVGNNRINQFRGGDELAHHRDRNEFSKRGGPMQDRVDRSNEPYRNARFPAHRQDQPREINQRHGNNGENAPHHHYNNVRDGNSSRNPQTKPDLKLHPHLNPANFNPKQFDCEPENARYFIIKSYSEDDIHRSIKYSIWCSTNHGNKRLDEAYRQQQAKNGQLFLFFSVNGSGHFCGMAQMMSPVDFDSSSGVWAQSKWQGEFSVKWIYVKDVPNSALRHITLENNEDKPVTNSRDTQEVPSEKGKAVLKILHQYNHTTSIFDDFLHYERRQEEEKLKKSSHVDQVSNHRSQERGMSGERANLGGARFNNRPYVGARGHSDFQTGRERPSRFAS